MGSIERVSDEAFYAGMVILILLAIVGTWERVEKHNGKFLGKNF